MRLEHSARSEEVRQAQSQTEIQTSGAGGLHQQVRAHVAPTVWFSASTWQLTIIPTPIPGESNSHC